MSLDLRNVAAAIAAIHPVNNQTNRQRIIEDAEARCAAEGIRLAKPDDIIRCERYPGIDMIVESSCWQLTFREDAFEDLIWSISAWPYRDGAPVRTRHGRILLQTTPFPTRLIDPYWEKPIEFLDPVEGRLLFAEG